jgi:regulator of sirC expression with transglutaminase-like and TPR domain
MDQDLLEEFEDCAADPSADEVRVAILVARALDPTVRSADVEARLAGVIARHDGVRPPWEFLQEDGFAGNRRDYDAFHNSNLAWVLEHRRGIPISLAVVLIGLSRAAGHAAVGINFPGHFLVQVDEVLVDPFAMTPVTRQALLRGLADDARGLPAERLFATASPVALGLRMLNNVKAGHLRAAAWHNALDMVDAQLRLAPEQAGLHLERGDLWQRLGLNQPARTAYETALALAAELPVAQAAELRRAAERRLGGLDGNDTVH